MSTESTNTAAPARFVYVTYIRTTQRKLWDALLKPEFTRQYWFGVVMESAWENGAAWKMVLPDGQVADAGTIVEIDPPKRMVIHWQHQWKPELTAEGFSRCTIELEPGDGGVMKLSILHELETATAGPSKFIGAVSGGWPKILASLKSFLETGQALPEQPKKG